MICASPWNHLARMSVAAFLVTLATSAQAQEQRFKAVSVKTPDGLTIHGFSQSHLSWIKQAHQHSFPPEGSCGSSFPNPLSSIGAARTGAPAGTS